ncbi:hypothetical protein [Streptomyces sp. MS1.AVA.4]|uniref:Uncharacterized protein n=1 Tax=Streptomyces pratisoli TaxID=3139917 RepID=A0ACC6QA98_9ACTN
MIGAVPRAGDVMVSFWVISTEVTRQHGKWLPTHGPIADDLVP